MAWQHLFSLLISLVSFTIVISHQSLYKKDLNFLPDLVANENDISVSSFSSEGSFGYATLCSFPQLELRSSSMQCLALALSILASHGRYPFTMLVPKKTKITRGYMQLIRQLNIVTYRYDEVPLPPAAKRYHGSKLSWLISYQRIHVFRLAFKRVLFLDYDMIVTSNIDDILAYESDMIGSDCTPHVMWPRGSQHRSIMKNFSRIGSIELISPSEANFQLLYDLIQNGTVVNASGHEAGWKWTQTDQTLFPATFAMGRLPCKYQVFPDMCYTATSPPLRFFPLKQFSIVHYTWTSRKGPAFLSRQTFLALLKRFAQIEQRWHPPPQPLPISSLIQQMPAEELAARYECVIQFGAIYQHFHRALHLLEKLLSHGQEVSLPAMFAMAEVQPNISYDMHLSTT